MGDSERQLPQEVSRGRIHIADGLEIEAVLLSDGQTVITEDSLRQFLEWLANAPLIEADTDPTP